MQCANNTPWQAECPLGHSVSTQYLKEPSKTNTQKGNIMSQDLFANDPLQDNAFQHDMGMQGSNLDPNQYDGALHSTPDLQGISPLSDLQLDNLHHQPFDLGGAELGDLGTLGSWDLPDVSDWNPPDLSAPSVDYGHANMHEPLQITSFSQGPTNLDNSFDLSPTSESGSPNYDLGGIQGDGNHEPSAITARQVTFHSASAEASPYTTIDDDGYIYKHTPDSSYGDWVGRIEDHEVRTVGGDYLGRAGLDGKVYDSHDHVIGWVDSNGHVYNEAGVKVYDTTMGVSGAAAYLLFVYHGGVQ